MQSGSSHGGLVADVPPRWAHPCERERVLDINKLSLGDRIVAISGVLLVVFAFFKWYGVDVGGQTAGFSGYHYFLFGVIPVILGVAMIVQIALEHFSDVQMPKLGNLTWGQIHLILGAIAFALVLLKVIIGDDYFSVSLDRKIGLFLALIAAAGLAGGGFLKMREAQAAAAGGSAPPPPTA